MSMQNKQRTSTTQQMDVDAAESDATENGEGEQSSLMLQQATQQSQRSISNLKPGEYQDPSPGLSGKTRQNSKPLFMDQFEDLPPRDADQIVKTELQIKREEYGEKPDDSHDSSQVGIDQEAEKHKMEL